LYSLGARAQKRAGRFADARPPMGVLFSIPYVELTFAYYNFSRIHKTIRCTPAMEAGITKSVWELKDLLAA
jgi:hypothetical protein